MFQITDEEINQLYENLDKVEDPDAVVKISKKYEEMDKMDDEIDKIMAKRKIIIKEIENLIKRIPEPKINKRKTGRPKTPKAVAPRRRAKAAKPSKIVKVIKGKELY
jgi:hypothetical protein